MPDNVVAKISFYSYLICSYINSSDFKLLGEGQPKQLDGRAKSNMTGHNDQPIYKRYFWLWVPHPLVVQVQEDPLGLSDVAVLAHATRLLATTSRPGAYRWCT